jgi:hypothetical protein
MVTGCKALFPSEEAHTKTKWVSFEEAQAAFDQIRINETRHDELKDLGFDPAYTPNVKILTYLDLVAKFMPNNSITLQDVPEPVRQCIVERDGCRAYELTVDNLDRKRYGNLLLDVFGFKKKTAITGWNYSALIITRNEVVVYKLRSGEPNVNKSEKKVKPLGPFQDLEGMVTKLPGVF